MAAKTTVRFPKELAELIGADAENKNVSQSQWMRDAAEHYLSCAKTDKVQSMKLIVFKYPTKCLKCGKQIEVGEWGLWGRGQGTICMDCYVERMGDKTYVTKYLKLRELKQAERAVKEELAKDLDKIDIYRVAEKHEEIDKLRQQILDLVRKFLTSQIGTDKEKEVIENLMQHDGTLDQYEHDIEEWLRIKLLGVKVKKKKQKAYEV